VEASGKNAIRLKLNYKQNRAKSILINRLGKVAENGYICAKLNSLMTLTSTNSAAKPRVSQMAENLIGSEIIRIAAEINELMKQGQKVYNLTIGDFDSNIFPIPDFLKEEIKAALDNNQTNYPVANGMLELRAAVGHFLQRVQGVTFDNEEILISAGARPLIYSLYMAVVDPGDAVIFPTPSWNNNHYCHLSGARPIMIETRAENNFMPTADEIRPHIQEATLLALCSPLNPTGTTFTKEGLEAICDLVVEENARRGPNQKPLYLMYDQIYWALTYGETKHYDPISLRPELRDYTIFIDGLSKTFAATGVRVGWAFGSKYIIDKMKSILTHVGAWAPKAEQIATAKFLKNDSEVDTYLESFKDELNYRLVEFYKGFSDLKAEGFKVDAIAPQAAIYLTVKFDLHGMKKADGKVLETTKDITSYLLNEAKLAIVPFYAFGSSDNSPWYRLSVGVSKKEEIPAVIENLRSALAKLS
jgi:aspartate aminotransferase